MANDEHVQQITQGSANWNDWRKNHLGHSQPDFSGAMLVDVDFRGADLAGANFAGANLGRADFTDASLEDALLATANLRWAKFTRARLQRANLSEADLIRADFHGADLTDAVLWQADLNRADLCEAKLIRTDLTMSNLVETNLSGTTLDGCKVYGISVWGLRNVQQAHQSRLIIARPRPHNEPTITVDDIEIAQFVYLLVNNAKIRSVINTIGQKAVLILGRFTERKDVLETIRSELLQRDYLPIVFDFIRPTDRDFSETVLTLAGMCRFVIADITKPRSVPQEAQIIIPNYMIPFVPIIQSGEEPWAMFEDLWRKHKEWVLLPLRYDSLDRLRTVFGKAVVNEANKTYAQIVARKAEGLAFRDVDEYE